MKKATQPSRHLNLRGLIASAMALFLIAPALRVAGAAPAVSKPLDNAGVIVADNGTNWTLNNGIVKATINKRNGDLEGLIYKGIETMGHDQGRAGYWEQDPSAAAQVNGLTSLITIDPAKNGGERAEVSIKGVTGGQVGLTPGSPGGAAGGTANLDLEIRYTMGRGESGVHVYGIFSHPAAYGPLNVPESRFITKLNQTFDWISVDADRNMLECAPKDWGTGVVVHAKEQRVLNQGVYKNSVEHKYSYTAVQYKIPAFGWSSTKDHVGIWFINPTIEYLSGGATKCELVSHFGDTDNPDPIILDYWRGTHFGGGATCNVAAGENWSKVVGPIFIYCNTLADPKNASPVDLATLATTAGNPTVPPAWKANATALWQDALSQAQKEKAQWPYDWVEGVDYPHKDARGNVTGQLVLNDPQAATTKLPHLTLGLAHADYGSGGRGGTIDWAHDAKFYQFWNDGSEDGQFQITNVRPGTYTLHAFADGVLGEFAQASITVTAGKTLELGKLNWQPVRYGRQLWEIGTPTRTAEKFYKGDGANYWLWGWPVRYGELFPNDITYTIGKSDWHKDWFFEQVPHELSDAWKNPDAKDPLQQPFGWVKSATAGEDMWRTIGRGRATTWTIKFNMDKATAGQATLRVALAGADGTGGLAMAVNGQGVGTIRTTATNALRYNTDKGLWQEQAVKFDAGLMKAGENEMTLTVPAGEVTSGVVYDYLRLELKEN